MACPPHPRKQPPSRPLGAIFGYRRIRSQNLLVLQQQTLARLGGTYVSGPEETSTMQFKEKPPGGGFQFTPCGCAWPYTGHGALLIILLAECKHLQFWRPSPQC